MSRIEEIHNEIRIHNITKDHPRFVRLLRVYEDSQFFNMVLEYYEGGTLFDIIAQEKILEEKEISLIMRQIMEGLEYLHSHKVVH